MNTDQKFVHLHVHSEYSLLEAACGVKAIAKKAQEFAMPAVALTDNGNMFGAIEFYFACLDKGVKPIIGLDSYLVKDHTVKGVDRNEVQRPPSRLVLLATSLEGYQNLCQISTIGYQYGFYYKPRIDEGILKKFSKDIIVLSGGFKGEIATSFLLDGPEVALEKIKNFKNIFDDRFYLEITRTGIAELNQVNKFLVEASKITHVPLVATNDIHYLKQDDQIAQEVLVCIGTNKTLQDESRFKLGSNQFYFKSSEEMTHLFSDLPEACARTIEIADRTNIKFKLKDEKGKPIYHLPTFPTRDGKTDFDEITRLSYEGLEVRFKEAEKIGEAILEENKQDYFKRLEYELGIIDRMGFNGYFLIVSDFINWAKVNEIPVGPGRGSGAGSLVAYCLRITDLNPLPYHLLFERFLNPERISMPDFDIDFCQDRRQEVIQYVTQKYGEKSVSQIITYGKLQCRAAIKDVGRVLGMTYAEVDIVSKLVPDKLNITIDEALELEPRLSELMESNPTVATLIDLAKKVEGLVRNSGIHAAGVIIASDELIKYAPLYKGSAGENVVQYDMKHSEKIGLIKFDFLGLKTLTHIQRALNIIEKNRGLKIRSQDISINDPGIYTLMSSGDTAGVFQFEGDGITNAIRLIKPSNFFDITAINALYRPGPMAMIPEFAKRKHGEAKVEFIFDELKDVLSETYGIIVYQEQVMGIASKIAGYSLGEADMLRRAMGKKIKEEMDQHRVRFLKGAKERGHDEKKSEELFELMYKFADYGFNKSHAAAYCVVAAQTAWLKNYYPAEFFAALLSTELTDTDKVVQYVKDAQKRGLKVLPPHVNHSDFLFTVKGQDIYYGLGAIKGIGESAVTSILEAREKLPEKKFLSLQDFFENVDLRKVNKKAIEVLIKSGAFEGFGFHRAQIMTGYSRFLDRAEEVRKDKELGQSSLFDLEPEAESKIELEDVKPWNRSASLTYEKEVLGFYLSDHPLKGFENMASHWSTNTIQSLFDGQFEKKQRVVITAIIPEKRELITKKGTRMAFAKAEDLTGSCELVIFPDVFSKTEGFLMDERPLLIGGALDKEQGQPKIIVDSMTPLEEAIIKTKRIRINLSKIEESNYDRLNSFLLENPGSTKIEMKIVIDDLQKEVLIEPENIPGVKLSNEFFENLHMQFGHTQFLEMNL